MMRRVSAGEKGAMTAIETGGATTTMIASEDATEIAKTTAGGTNTTTTATGGARSAEIATEKTTTTVSVGEKSAEIAIGGTVVEVRGMTSGVIDTGVEVETRRIEEIDGTGVGVEMMMSAGEGGKRGIMMARERIGKGETDEERERREYPLI